MNELILSEIDRRLREQFADYNGLTRRGDSITYHGITDADAAPIVTDVEADYDAGKLGPDYRELRAAAYIEKLSPEGSFNTSVGDLLDAVIKALYGDFSELDELSTIIQQIKAQYPKP